MPDHDFSESLGILRKFISQAPCTPHVVHVEAGPPYRGPVGDPQGKEKEHKTMTSQKQLGIHKKEVH